MRWETTSLPQLILNFHDLTIHQQASGHMRCA
jgi:hypothetical protein